jgi:hypothetical protein
MQVSSLILLQEIKQSGGNSVLIQTESLSFVSLSKQPVWNLDSSYFTCILGHKIYFFISPLHDVLFVLSTFPVTVDQMDGFMRRQ